MFAWNGSKTVSLASMCAFLTRLLTRVCTDPQLGRFTLRDQGQTIAIGKITKLVEYVN